MKIKPEFVKGVDGTMSNRAAKRRARRTLMHGKNLETFSRAICEKTKKMTNRAATDNTMTVVLSVLHKEYGFGPKRLGDFYQHTADLTLKINSKTESIKNLQDMLNHDCDMNFGSR